MPKTRIKLPQWLTTTLRILLGCIFILSSVAKMLDVDSFEMYVFSYGFFSLNVVDILVRLCLAAELIMGIMIALGWMKRLIKVLAILMLVFFSIFLCYAALRGRMESCQCFGQLVEFDPIQSLLKNAVLLLWVLIAYHGPDTPAIGKKKVIRLIVSAAIVVVVTATIFIVSVPDSWMFGESGNRYNPKVLDEAIAPDGVLGADKLDHGKHLVAFVTPGCPFCQMSRQKISTIAERHNLDTTSIHYVQPDDIGDSIFMRLTFGSRPLVVLLDDGNVVSTYHYRNISERQIAGTLPKRL